MLDSFAEQAGGLCVGAERGKGAGGARVALEQTQDENEQLVRSWRVLR